MSGTLRLRGSTSGYSELQAPAVAADQTFVLPTAGGTLLTTDSPVPKLTLELGSASQPSLTFQGDTDTGLFSEGTNTLNLVTGGSSKVVLGAAAHTIYAGTGATVRAIDIDSSGNIGVGTSSPQQVLHLASSAATTLLQFNDSGSGGTAAQVRIGSAGNDFVVLNNTASNTATERLRITSGGRVGIGTTSPDAAAKLVVSDGGEEGLEIRAGYNVGASEFIAYNRTSSTYIDLRYDAGHHAFKIAGSEKARIDSSGRLLVQSSSAPTQGLYSQYAPLTVQGYIGSTTGNGILNIARGTTASSLSNGSDIGTIVFSDSAGGEFSRISCFADAAPGSNDYPGRISFHTSADGSSNPTERMRIDSSGRVGIGVTDPGSYYGSGNDLVVGGAASHGITIKAGTTGQGIITFADGTSGGAQQYAGYILYDHSTNHIQFATGATERLRITSDGKVGIGVSAPLATLEVNGDTGVIVHPTSANTTGQIQIAGTRTLGAAAVAIVNLKAIPENPTGNSDAAAFAVETRSGGTGTVTERMRIKSNGWNQSVAVDHVQTNSSAAGAGVIYFFFAGKHSATLGAADSGTTSIAIYTNGNIVNTNNSYGPISDVKLKENIVDANSQWDDLKALRVVNFNFKQETGYETHKQLGFIAQEVEQVSPGLVYNTPDRDEEGNDLGTVTKVLQASVLYTKAVKALQEAMERIETLEQRLSDAGIA